MLTRLRVAATIAAIVGGLALVGAAAYAFVANYPPAAACETP